jgi:hypothetical protein
MQPAALDPAQIFRSGIRLSDAMRIPDCSALFRILVFPLLVTSNGMFGRLPLFQLASAWLVLTKIHRSKPIATLKVTLIE